MTGGDRISDLPDDLLQHILYCVPAKEGASTSALARRWRTQWLSSGAVNLDTCSYPGDRMQLYSNRPAFVHDSGVALAAHGRRWPLRKFTVRVEVHQRESVEVFLCRGDDIDDILDPMLKHQALRPVEELCIDGHAYRLQFEDRHESGYYELSVASLPSKNLRVLRISSCKCLKWPVALQSQATGLTRLDIGFYPNSFSTTDQTCASFSQSVESFNNAKVFKLKSNNIEFITAVSGELEVQFKPGQSKATGQAIAYILHCCPVIRQLRLTLSTTASETCGYGGYENETDPFGVKDELDFGKSFDQFFSRRGRKNPMITHEVSDHIHGLSGESFTCLQSSLTSVSLRFRRDKSECFGVRLAKFFAENAMVLEELYIDGGNQKLHDHINHTVGRCVAGSTSGFAVLPLERSK
ncbi:hypothetical protein ACQ4PT_068298 [Festuca glaucescens]